MVNTHWLKKEGFILMHLRHRAFVVPLGLILTLGAWGCGGGRDPIEASTPARDVTVAPSAKSYEASLEAEKEQQERQAELDRQMGY